MVDLVTMGETMALFQAMPEGPLRYAPLFMQSVAGAESNVAIALSRLGFRTRWISRLGVDPFGDLIAGALAGEGVDVSQVIRDPNAPTAIFFREVKTAGEPHAFYYRGGSAASRLSPDDVIPDWFADARHLHVTGITPALGSQTEAATVRAMECARELGLTISFDPNLRRKLWDDERARRVLLRLAALCDILLPGLDEAEFLVGGGPLPDLASALLKMGPRVVVIKQSALGATAFSTLSGGPPVYVPAYPVHRVIDPIGAGDAFAAGFLSVLLEEPGPANVAVTPDLLLRSVTRANLMGSLATQFRGDWEGLPTSEEIRHLEANTAHITR